MPSNYSPKILSSKSCWCWWLIRENHQILHAISHRPVLSIAPDEWPFFLLRLWPAAAGREREKRERQLFGLDYIVHVYTASLARILDAIDYLITAHSIHITGTHPKKDSTQHTTGKESRKARINNTTTASELDMENYLAYILYVMS